MSLFNFSKKKDATESQNDNQMNECSCGGNCSATNSSAKIIVLGACCKKSAETFANVKQAVAELGISETVANIGDSLEIAKYGVMQTPALVINGKIVSYGKLIKLDEAKTLILKAGL